MIKSLANNNAQHWGSCVDNMDHNKAEHHIMMGNSNHLSSGTLNTYKNNNANEQVDMGLTRNWSEYLFGGTRDSNTMDGEKYTEYVKRECYKDTTGETIILPKNKNGTEYKLENLGPINGNMVSK